jgi:hypothetical protein
MQSAPNKPFMLSVIMVRAVLLNIIIPNTVMPFCNVAFGKSRRNEMAHVAFFSSSLSIGEFCYNEKAEKGGWPFMKFLDQGCPYRLRDLTFQAG